MRHKKRKTAQPRSDDLPNAHELAVRRIHKLSVEERGVHAASAREGQERFGDSDSPAVRTLKRAEARAPTGGEGRGMGVSRFNERQNPRTAQSVCVPKADLAAQGYDLSLNRRVYRRPKGPSFLSPAQQAGFASPQIKRPEGPP